jgi:alpha-beta hydrolase superfamily lysophospholipase
MTWMGFVEIFLYALGFLVLVILTQDIHIFPGSFTSRLFRLIQKRVTPLEVESVTIKSSDGVALEVWRYEGIPSDHHRRVAAIICHGNGGSMEHFLFVQMWLAEQGICSYNFDYRAFGQSGGLWPSESGMYRDAEAVAGYVLERERIGPEDLIVVGISIGSGPASKLAAEISPAVLLLVSAFTDLRSVVRSQKPLGILAPFVWHRFPTEEHIEKLRDTHLLLAHGMQDRIVPAHHSESLEKAYQGEGSVTRFESAEAGHNLALYALRRELASKLGELLGH